MTREDRSEQMTIELIPSQVTEADWSPVPGSETRALNLPEQARAQIVNEALRILRRCVPPTGSSLSQTGLVVGYVQSGKTTSFITLAALARDNGYRMVIVIAGTTKPLFGQTNKRLIKALRLEGRPRNNPWRHIAQPRTRDDSHSMIRSALLQWESPHALPEERRTVLITVMKHHRHLQNLIDVIQLLNIQHIPTLIIDDEGDQASLNTLVNQGEESTTYSRLLALKACLPLHSYIQYTATPQAPLLIGIVDVLSPSFAEILKPGDGYVGGADFFLRNPTLVRDIPATQIPSSRNSLNGPPSTMLEAMRLFFVAAALGYEKGTPESNCSMMVHPSQRTDPHRRFYTWVNETRDEWQRVIDLAADDQDKIDLLDLFRSAYADLKHTVPSAPPFESLMPRLRQAISQTYIREINTRGSRRTPDINWGENYSWILVGGQAMDRGFTVEGLVVTYMPRELGMGNADTVQQRARFFGYKRDYLGLCRIFVGPDVRRAFRGYVEHEEDIRESLSSFAQSGRALSEWRREFFLTSSLRPTRNNVIDVAYQRIRLGNDWVFPNGPQNSIAAVDGNRVLFEKFLSRHSFTPHNGLDLRQGGPLNLVLEDVSLRTVHEELLTRYRVSRLDDSLQFGALLHLIQVHLTSEPDASCSVFLMGSGKRRRRGYADDRIKELFQGRQYASGRITYPGDREVRGNGVTIQMSYLDLGQRDAPLIAENVPHLAVWVPASMARDGVSQPQGDWT
ncbi:MAG: hypothetical protein JNM83_27920 [Myxococcales bacterium]|nr:hypothetical protein [Myxococcales bacterium]